MGIRDWRLGEGEEECHKASEDEVHDPEDDGRTEDERDHDEGQAHCLLTRGPADMVQFFDGAAEEIGGFLKHCSLRRKKPGGADTGILQWFWADAREKKV